MALEYCYFGHDKQAPTRNTPKESTLTDSVTITSNSSRTTKSHRQQQFFPCFFPSEYFLFITKTLRDKEGPVDDCVSTITLLMPQPHARM